MAADPSFLERIWALRGMPQQHSVMRLTDAILLAPLARSFHRAMEAIPPKDLERLLESCPGPIHWIRPGGMGDWVVLAPFLESVHAAKGHEDDTLWVTPGAFSLAQAYHASSGLRVRLATGASLSRARAPYLVMQLEPFHPAAWVWACLLRTSLIAGYPPGDPCRLAGPPVRPMIEDMTSFHPGVAPHYPVPLERNQRDRVLVFASGTHRSRALPATVADRLLERGIQDVCWFGPMPMRELPRGWEWVQGPLPPEELLSMIRRAAGVIAPDSGPFHLGRLLGAPTVGYFTSGEVDRWGWTAPRSKVVVTSFHCKNCIKVSLPAPCPWSFGCIQATDGIRLVDTLTELMEELR